jgi:stage II sporulation protein R
MKRAFGLVFLLVFFFSLWTAGMDEAAASGLPEKLLRLRVVAQSDSAADQADKLLVRDAVLDALQPRITGCATLEEARTAAAAALPQVAEAAGQALTKAGRPRPLTLRLGAEVCPLRAYETFTLPAGQYETLTVTLGSGKGHNWWGVVFPPLCLAAAGEVGEEDGEEEWSVFSPAEKRLVTSGGVELRFRGLELWQKLRKWLGG